MEIILASFVIKHCPGCGEPFKMGRMAMSDYLHGASVSCDCGVHVQYMYDTNIMVKAADEAGGDLSNWVRRQA